MEKITRISGFAAYLPISNIDTDMIIPKQYLKTIQRSGLGKGLFAQFRYRADGSIKEDFILNQHPDTKILFAGDNFGCGSSREHAPWALLDFGIKVIVAPSFADIFYNNCFKNGILPIHCSQSQIDSIVKHSADVCVDLPTQTITTDTLQIPFEIEAHRKAILLQGLDEIERILKFKSEIADFEQIYHHQFPWLKA